MACIAPVTAPTWQFRRKNRWRHCWGNVSI